MFFDTGIDVCKYFAHLMKKALTFKNVLYSEVPVMSLSLVYYLIIAAINLFLKSFKTSISLRSILSTSSDSYITSGRSKVNEQYKRKL